MQATSQDNLEELCPKMAVTKWLIDSQLNLTLYSPLPHVILVVFVDAFRGKATSLSLSVSLSPRFRLGTKGNVSADAKMLAMLSFSWLPSAEILQYGRLVAQFHPREKHSGCIANKQMGVIFHISNIRQATTWGFIKC